MFSWPSLSSIPTTIQRRFLSFILKRSLGHLVKPGQLDPDQIDAQISSGFVHINDLELDHDAINEHLSDLSLSLRLEAGSIGKVSARVPWPNLLTAPFTLSLSSLSLTFMIVPHVKAATHLTHTKDELAESAAAVAASFIHDELSERENQTLHESLQIESDLRQYQPPGSINPFLGAEDLDAGEHTDRYDEGDDDGTDPSTQGVSLLATFIERLLARFEFDTSDVTVRIVLPRKAEFVLRLGHLTYSTESTPDSSGSPIERQKDSGDIRTVKVVGVSIHTRDLTPLSHRPSSTSRRRSASPFASSSSSEDDEVMMMMSQSLASLPPPSSARSISPSSTMYHSATSSVRSLSPDLPRDREERECIEEKILSLGFGSEPVVICLISPPLVVPMMQTESPQDHANSNPLFYRNWVNKLRLTVALGPVATALNPVQAQSLFQLSSTLAASRSVYPSSKRSPSPSANSIEVSMHIKSITLLLLQTPSPLPAQPTMIDPLQHFFLARSTPSPSPRVPHLRLQFDALDFSCIPFQTANAPQCSNATGLHVVSQTGISRNILEASLADISIFAFCQHPHGTGENWRNHPVLVSDPYLCMQYDRDVSFPAFDVIDWTRSEIAGEVAKVSQWRVRPPHAKQRSSGAGLRRTSHVPVIHARLDSNATVQNTVCEIHVIPLHFFFDVGIVQGAVNFLSTANISHSNDVSDDAALDVEIEDTPPATPRAKGRAVWKGGEKDGEKTRLEHLVMDDFADLGVVPSAQAGIGLNFILHMSLFRVQIRAQPPLSWNSTPRSGAFVLDVHDLRLTQQDMEATATGRTAQFKSDGSRSRPKVLGTVEFRRLLVAATLPGEPKASTLLSITAQSPIPENPRSTSGVGQDARPYSPAVTLLPVVCLRSNPVVPRRPSTATSPGVTSSFSLDVNIPSALATITKPTLDALTFWADDIAQCLFGDGEGTSASYASGRSRDPSLIGSRFFTKRTVSTESSESGAEGRRSEVVAKLSIAKARLRLYVPRKGHAGQARPLDVTASDVDFLAEIKPEGKDETVVTVGVMDLDVSDTSTSGDVISILNLTIPRHITASSKSLLKLRFISTLDNDTAAKESRLKITASGFTYLFTPDFDWVDDVGLFAKTPEGAFESVVPSERTKVAIKITDGSVRLVAPNYPGSMVAYIGELDFSTDIVGDSPETMINAGVPNFSLLFVDDIGILLAKDDQEISQPGFESWKQAGYALLAEVHDLEVRLRYQTMPSVSTQINVDNVNLSLHACADSLPAVGLFLSDLSSILQGTEQKPSLPRRPTSTSRNSHPRHKRDVFATVDEHAFRRVPSLGPAPDMIHDDLPTNLDYLDASFGPAAGLREFRDDDLLDFEPHESNSGRNTPTSAPGIDGVIANFGGETIRILDPRGIRVVERHFENIPQEAADLSSGSGDTKLSIRVQNCDMTVSLYDGYDWLRTRKVIEDEVRAIRRRLVKIRQLLASGQTPDDSIEETSAMLFNSVYIGLPQDPDELEPGALIAAIDAELNDDPGTEAESQSSWQSFKQKPHQGGQKSPGVQVKKLSRSRHSRIEFCLNGIQAEVNQFHNNVPLVSRVLVTVRDMEILDHIKTSTWKKFLTELRTDFRGNVRETASNMVRVELRIVRPAPELPTEEGRLRAKVLPIKLHVDQDALDFIKKFLSFHDPKTPVTSAVPDNELYFQHVEVFPVDIKLDYKPKRVDYHALREGQTIELMNFFHFDGAEITLRHITLSGITGWARLFETLNDLWTPDVKANQLADIISAVSPIRSLVNVGSGVADLVLLPIAQYKKDKRVVRGVQKGTTSFVKSTALEAIKLGARLATGTQIILEQTETVLGGQGQFRDTVTAETLQSLPSLHSQSSDEDSEVAELISKYADQPQDVREGIQSAYRSLSKNLNSAAQTILAVPMEVYERSGNEGPVRAIIRAVPIAVLKPMIGASEAVSKTLFGLHNTMDPEIKHENEAKYKQR